MIVLQEIRDNLIEAIKTSGMTQSEIAKKLGVRQQSVGKYLQGIAMPILDTFANLCAILDLDANEILNLK